MAMIRALGNLEKYSTARHNLGYYRSVACTARYAISESPEDLSDSIEVAVAQTILKHPVLRCGIINEDGSNPSFVRLESIDLNQSIEYRTVTASTAAEYENGFNKILETQHNELWPDLDRRPGWKVIVVQPEMPQPQKQKTIDIIFPFHHSIADGVSGRVFHATLQAALNNIKEVPDLNDRVLKLPGSIDLVPSIEQLVDLKISWLFLLRGIWSSIKPAWLFPAQNQPWTGAPCSLPSIEEYSSRIKVFSIPADSVPAILTACREQKSTLTGLLHGLIVTSLSFRMPEASSFSTSTPYSLRAITGSSPTDDMCSQTSAMSADYSPETISEIRNVPSGSEQLAEKVWDVARAFKTSIVAELAQLPNDNPLGLLRYVSDMHKYFTSKLGEARGGTYEISNINGLTNPSKDARWKVERLLFSQCGMVLGTAMAFNVASVTEGLLTISVTWQEGIVEETLVDAVAKDVEDNLLHIARGEAIS